MLWALFMFWIWIGFLDIFNVADVHSVHGWHCSIYDDGIGHRKSDACWRGQQLRLAYYPLFLFSTILYFPYLSERRRCCDNGIFAHGVSRKWTNYFAIHGQRYLDTIHSSILNIFTIIHKYSLFIFIRKKNYRISFSEYYMCNVKLWVMLIVCSYHSSTEYLYDSACYGELWIRGTRRRSDQFLQSGLSYYLKCDKYHCSKLFYEIKYSSLCIFDTTNMNKACQYVIFF